MAFDQRLALATPIWVPLPGPQTAALNTEADFLFYGGQAGGGKTDLLIGAALTQHVRSIIYRRQARQLEAIKDRTAEIIQTRDGFNAQTGVWRLSESGNPALKGKQLEFGGVKDPGSEMGFQGRPHDLKGFDEITHFLEAQFRFLCGWNRTVKRGQRCRVIATGNPPTEAEGEWIIRFWGPWLDAQHSNPATPGELRWFARIGDEDIEVEDGKPFRHGDELIEPKSRTFIPAAVDDNPFLIGTGYKAMLQALPEPLRSQMLFGDFSAGRADDAFQVIPTDWIKQAQDRWEAGNTDPMTAVGVDVARGGSAETVLARRHGSWYAPIIRFPGEVTPDGPKVAGLVVTHRTGGAMVQIDVIGVGSSPYDHLNSAGVPVTAMNGAERTNETDKAGQLKFFNKRSMWWWRMREALDPVNGDNLSLPKDRTILADLAAPRWSLRAGKIKVEEKDDTIKRLGRSPDVGDAVVLALPTMLVDSYGNLEDFSNVASDW